jgi:predicted small metal-binding protein
MLSRTTTPHRKVSPMKVVHCPCGTDVKAETDDELVSNVEDHVKENHPEMVGTMSREQILEMAHDH